MEFIKRIQQFFSYWYVRYLLATELYMVETWEKITIHVIFATIFFLFWFFNYSIVRTCISHLRNTVAHDIEQIL